MNRQPNPSNPSPTAERCRICGQPIQLIEVHGKRQCRHCGFPLDSCCTGTHQPTDPTPDHSAPNNGST